MTALAYLEPDPALDRRLLADDDGDLAAFLGAVSTPREELPAPGPVARALVQAVLEVLAGDRPARQLCGQVGQRLFADIEARAGRRAIRPAALSVRSVHVCEPRPGVAEVSAVVVGLEPVAAGRPATRATASRRRCRAVALRLEGLDGRWILTALSVG